MKNLKITLVSLVLALDITAQADGLYDITFSDGGANVGFGQLNVQSGFAIGGFFNVTSGAALGSFSLYTAGGTVAFPGFLPSPGNNFNYNNAVYLTLNPQFPATNPYVDGSGLLFTDLSGNEINLWGNADGSYTFYGVINGIQYNPQALGVSTITPVPEPSSLAAITLLLIPVGAFVRKLKFQS